MNNLVDFLNENQVHYQLMLLFHQDQWYEFFLHDVQHYFDDVLDNHINNIEIILKDDH